MISIPRAGKEAIVAAGGGMRMVMAVTADGIVVGLVVPMLIAMLIAMLIGAHHLMIVWMFLGAGDRADRGECQGGNGKKCGLEQLRAHGGILLWLKKTMLRTRAQGHHSRLHPLTVGRNLRPRYRRTAMFAKLLKPQGETT
jgi:hypothetical protein